jgi:hypothetical protein
MQHKINKENLAVALKKSKLNFLEFLTKFVKYHVTKGNKNIDPQDTNTFTWVKNIYNNTQDHYEENTINTLSKVLSTDLKSLIQHDQINLFNKDYEIFLRTRVSNYLKSKINIEDAVKFVSEISEDSINYLKSCQNASNKPK